VSVDLLVIDDPAHMVHVRMLQRLATVPQSLTTQSDHATVVEVAMIVVVA
jgi:hypothetical protein